MPQLVQNRTKTSPTLPEIISGIGSASSSPPRTLSFLTSTSANSSSNSSYPSDVPEDMTTIAAHIVTANRVKRRERDCLIILSLSLVFVCTYVSSQAPASGKSVTSSAASVHVSPRFVFKGNWYVSRTFNLSRGVLLFWPPRGAAVGRGERGPLSHPCILSLSSVCILSLSLVPLSLPVCSLCVCVILSFFLFPSFLSPLLYSSSIRYDGSPSRTMLPIL